MNKTNKCVMVCVTPQETCAGLIEAGKITAETLNQKLVIVSVIGTKYQNNIDQLNYLYECVEKSGAELKLYFNNEPSITAAVIAKRINAGNIITGFPGIDGGAFIPTLHDLVPDIPISMVDENKTVYRMLPIEKEPVNSVSV